MKKIFFALLILALTGGAAFLLIKTRPPSEPVVVEEKSWTVQVMTAQPQRLHPQLRLYARIESPYSASLSAAVNAEVLEMPVREGDIVKQGEVLLRLDQRELKLAVQQREAEVRDAQAAIASEKKRHANNLSALPREKKLLELTRNAAKRAQRLQKQRVASESSVEDALQAVERQALTLSNRTLQIDNHPATLQQLEARLKRAKVQFELAQIELERGIISAPFNGIIAKLQTAPGERVRVGTPLLSLYDMQALEARTQIPDRYLDIVFTALQQDKPLYATARSKGRLIKLELNRLAGQVQNNSGGTEALFRVIDGATALRLGTFLDIRLQLPAEEAVVAVPYEAIYGNHTLYLLQEGRMQKQRVERLGEYETAEGDVFSLVRSEALQNGEKIILTHLPNAMQGLKVRGEERGEALVADDSAS